MKYRSVSTGNCKTFEGDPPSDDWVPAEGHITFAGLDEADGRVHLSVGTVFVGKDPGRYMLTESFFKVFDHQIEENGLVIMMVMGDVTFYYPKYFQKGNTQQDYARYTIGYVKTKDLLLAIANGGAVQIRG